MNDTTPDLFSLATFIGYPHQLEPPPAISTVPMPTRRYPDTPGAKTSGTSWCG